MIGENLESMYQRSTGVDVPRVSRAYFIQDCPAQAPLKDPLALFLHMLLSMKPILQLVIHSQALRQHYPRNRDYSCPNY